MRPEILFSLFKPVTTLSGVGPRVAKSIEKAAGTHLADLLWHLPSGFIDRRFSPKIKESHPGVVATMVLSVDKHYPPPPRNSRLPYKVICSDDTGKLSLIFFHAHAEYLRRMLPEGEMRVVSGKVEHFGKEIQITHPDHIVLVEELASIQSVEPTYPLSAGLSPKVLRKALNAALEQAPDFDEWIDAAFLAKQKWQPWRKALLCAHAPEDEADLSNTSKPRARLAYDEILANQLALSLVRLNMRRSKGRIIEGDGQLRAKLLDALAFQLTASQNASFDEIAGDMAEDFRMLRLLQGDVGSGKTVVALLAALNAIETGAQAAFMTPTEILARQHMFTLAPLAEACGVTLCLLTGREKGKKREAILEGLKNGATQLAIGTHALFQDDVAFSDLALAVIDEQHRFGVHQRMTLTAKGRAVDILVMTATPIPRTLMLTAYGDMDVSRLVEKPAGRKPVDTRVIPLERLSEVTSAISRSLDDGAKVYWVCPLVSESEALDLAAAEERFNSLKDVFKERVGLVHGQMKGRDKDAAMESFVQGATDILVATTVIEVGVDVPDATVMVIEHAERYGLSQLHQLRGRIGRGEKKSVCLLLYASPLSETAKARLSVVRQTDDGFLIAEEDLRLRGAGELLGTKQSGIPDFRLADISAHQELLEVARDDAKLILERDENLQSTRGQALRVLLYLFERDAAVKYLQSG
jgi:ATP-dependent DNA helicase RecG